MPPDNCQGYLRSKPSSPTIFNSAIARAWNSARGRFLTSTGIMTLRNTSRHGSSMAVWNTMPTLLCGLVIVCPSTRISPSLGGSSPAIIFSSVVLPHPDGPTTTTNSPS